MIHGENPFVDGPDLRDPVRRFRGRLTAPVTIVTSGSGAERTGLTVSSLMVIEGDPGLIRLVVGPTSDLWETVAPHRGFVVHICREEDRQIAETFAGLRPSPGGIFTGLNVTDGEFGPVIDRLPNRAHCRFVERSETGYSGIVSGEVVHVEAGEISDPLVYYRGGYRSLS